ncbi:Dabb family protein [Bacteroidota bacterium]
MIRHIVMFKLKEFESVEEKLANAQKVKMNFLDLKSRIKEIKSFEVGLNIINSKSSYDIVINSVFENIDELIKYQEHPAHISAVNFNSDYSEKKVVVDYEFQ